MTYKQPIQRTYAYKISAAQDWNVLVENLKDHEARILALEALGGITEPTNLPVGGIIMWSGNVVDVPEYFQLCDGTNGTPDLRNLFVIGAGGDFNPGDDGGAEEHQHSGGGVSSAGGHTHSFSGNTGGPSSTNQAGSGGYIVAASGHKHSFSGTTGSGGSHSHSLGSSGMASSYPPYYALAFIMRMS